MSKKTNQSSIERFLVKMKPEERFEKSLSPKKIQKNLQVTDYTEFPRMKEYINVECKRCERGFHDFHEGENELTIHDVIKTTAEHIDKCSKRQKQKMSMDDIYMEAISLLFNNINTLQEDNKKLVSQLMFTITCDICNRQCRHTKSLSGNLYEYMEHLKQHQKEGTLGDKSITDYMNIKYKKIITFIEKPIQ